MKKFNPLKQPIHFIIGLSSLSIGLGVMNIFNPQHFSTYILACVVYTIIMTINIIFGKKIETSNISDNIKHVFVRNEGELKYVNGIPLSTGFHYSHSLEQSIETIEFKGFFFGKFTETQVVSEKRFVDKNLLNNQRN